MSTFVLLTDGNSGSALVACPDQDTARRVGSAAVFNDGGVSAWLVPTKAIGDPDEVIRVLRDGGDCADLERLDTIPVHIEEK